MPVTPNLMRVRRPTPSACPSSLTGRSYLGLLESGGSLHAYRYTDGVYQETLRSQAISGFTSPDLAAVFRHHGGGDIVIFEANAGAEDAIVTWDIGAGSFAVLSVGVTAGDADPMVADDTGNFVWTWRRGGGVIESYRAAVGSAGSVVAGRENGDPRLWGFIEDAAYLWFGSLLPTAGGVFTAGHGPAASPNEGVLSELPSGPVAAASGLRDTFASNLDIGAAHASGALTVSRRQPDGSAVSAAGILAADGAWSRWTPLAWDDLGILQYARPSPSGSEWLLQASIGGATKLARFANGAVGDDCPLPAFDVDAAPEGVPDHFLCRDH